LLIVQADQDQQQQYGEQEDRFEKCFGVHESSGG
jgi:hypothetical protein